MVVPGAQNRTAVAKEGSEDAGRRGISVQNQQSYFRFSGDVCVLYAWKPSCNTESWISSFCSKCVGVLASIRSSRKGLPSSHPHACPVFLRLHSDLSEQCGISWERGSSSDWSIPAETPGETLISQAHHLNIPMAEEGAGIWRMSSHLPGFLQTCVFSLNF